jgi:hypothetical protein
MSHENVEATRQLIQAFNRRDLAAMTQRFDPRGAKVAQIDIARKLTVAIWHMLTRNESFAPKGAAFVWRPDRPFGLAPGANIQ